MPIPRVLSALFLILAGCAGSESDTAAPAEGQLEVAQAPAQGGDEHPGVERRLAHMREELGLDDAQVELVRPILERAADQRRAAHAEVREQLAAVLTPEQLARLDEHMAHHRGRHEGRGRRGRFGAGGRLAHMFDELALTDEQKAQVAPILESIHAQHEGIRDLAPEERRAAIESAHAELRAQLVPILTADQLARFDEMAARMRERFNDRASRAPSR